MSRQYPAGPTIPPTSNFDTNYTRYIKSGILQAISITSGSLNVSQAKINSLTVGTLSVTQGSFSTMTVGSLSSSRVTNLLAPVANNDAANKAYVDASVVSGSIQNLIVVQKNPRAGEFLTIEEALASITDASSTNPYCVVVGPGIYTENVLNIPAYVSVRGESILTTIVTPVVPNQNLFVMAAFTEISFMSLQGTTGSLSPGAGTGYAAIYAEDISSSIDDYALAHKITIVGYDIGVKNVSTSADSYFYTEFVDITDYSYAAINQSPSVSAGHVAYLSCENFFTLPSSVSGSVGYLSNGVDCYTIISGADMAGTSTMKGFQTENGGTLNLTSIAFSGYSIGIECINIGTGASFLIDGSSFENCTTNISIQNVGTSGYFFGYSPDDKNIIVDGSSFFIANNEYNTITVAPRGADFTSIKDAVDSITDSSTTNPYVVNVSPGIFYEDTITLKTGILLIGSSIQGTIIIPNSVSQTMVVGADNSTINNVTLTGATNGKGVYFEGTTGIGFLVQNCGLNNCNTLVHAHGTSIQTNCLVRNCNVSNAGFTTGFLSTNTSSVVTRLITSGITHTDLTLPVCKYFASVTGTNATFTMLNTTLGVAPTSASTCFYIGSGGEIRVVGSSIRGFGKCIHVPSGSSNAIINGSGSLITESVDYDILIENDTTVGVWQGSTIYTKVSIPLTCPFYISGQDTTVVTVQKAGGNFTSVSMAMAAITQNSTINRFIIQVGSGTFTEPVITMKPFVSLVGSGRATRIEPDTTGHHIIVGTDFSEIDSFIVNGAGTGYAAIYLDSTTGTLNTSFIARNMLFGINDIHMWAYGSTGFSNIILFSSRFGGTARFNYGFRATNNNNTATARITMLACTSQEFTDIMPTDVFYASGENCFIEVNGLNIVNSGSIDAGTSCFRLGNKGHFSLIGINIKGFTNGIIVENTGDAPELVVVGTSISNCTNDLVIEHPDTFGSVNISCSRVKTTIDSSSPISVFIVDPDDKGVAFAGPFYYDRGNFGNVTNISELILDTPTLGLLSGGLLETNGGLSVAITAGYGYQKSGSEPDIYIERTWTRSTLSVPVNSTVYIYIDSSGVWTSNSSYPDTNNNILVGLVSTNSTEIIYLQQIPLNAYHYNNNLNLMLKNAIGPVYFSGSSVAELGTRQLTVSQGTYYFTNIQFIPDGASPATFNIFYRSTSSGIFSVISAQTTVPNGFYDNGTGTLAALTTSYYVKHLLLLVGGPSEKYVLIYGQAEYSSQGLAEAGGLPLTPSFISDAFVRVASIVVQQGSTNIISFIDERPRIGFASTSVTGAITVHGDLLGLSADDHPQYLLRAGTAAMTGNLDLSGNNILNPGLYNGFNVSAHASRHAFNGADPLTPALVGDIAEITDSTASAGINNTRIPRADHQHAHGNRGGGSLHATATTVSAGFISASNQLKLNGIEAGATNTTRATSMPLNVTAAAADAGVSLEVSRSDHKHDINTGAPTTTLLTTTSAAEGSSESLARADHTHGISTAAPAQQIPDQTNTIGNSTAFARADHIHNIPTGVAVSLDANSTSSQGAANLFARSNHSHAIASGGPSNQTITTVTSAGTSVAFARADHIHTFTTAGAVNQTIATATSAGISTAFSRSDHIHTFTTAGAVNQTIATETSAGVSTAFARSDHVHTFTTAGAVNQTIATETNAGVSTAFSRSDHIHTFSTGVPVTIGTTNTEGVSTAFARSDHVHNHGNQAGGSLHADVIAGGASGFMTGTDKTKLDSVESGATANPVNFLSVITTATTASTTYVALTSTTLTPGAGNYIVMFNAGQVGNTNNSRTITFAVYIDTDLVTDSERPIVNNGTTNTESINIVTKVTVTAGQAINIRWKTSANTASVTQRTLTLIKTSS